MGLTGLIMGQIMGCLDSLACQLFEMGRVEECVLPLGAGICHGVEARQAEQGKDAYTTGER